MIRRQPGRPEIPDLLEGATADDLLRWPNAREMFLSCRCGASGTVLVDGQTVLWSALPYRQVGGRIEHDCSKPYLRRPVPTDQKKSKLADEPPVARDRLDSEQLVDDMETLRYFTTNGTFAVWGPLRSKTGAAKRNRLSHERYGHGPGSLPSAYPGSLVRSSAAFIKAAEDPALRERIADLAAQFRAATPAGQRSGDPITSEQKAILGCRPLTVLDAADTAFHKDEGQERHKHLGRPIRERFHHGFDGSKDNEDGTKDPLQVKKSPFHPIENQRTGYHIDSYKLLDSLPSIEKTVILMHLEGWERREIATQLSITLAQHDRALAKGRRNLAAKVRREKMFEDAA